MAQLVNKIQRFLPDGRVIVETESGSTFVGVVGTIPGNGLNLVILGDPSAAPVPAEVEDTAALQAQTRADQEELRRRRTEEARGLEPGQLDPHFQSPTADDTSLLPHEERIGPSAIPQDANELARELGQTPPDPAGGAEPEPVPVPERGVPADEAQPGPPPARGSKPGS